LVGRQLSALQVACSISTPPVAHVFQGLLRKTRGNERGVAGLHERAATLEIA